ncbi:MAG TPA: response regulator [Acetobacteraceae bacterium]|nr:response regulator [Acetobacteraceae bacterium]
MTATRVMVVEDERIVALHLKQQLLKLGYDVVGVAASGERALRLVNELRPDVVLMDIHIEGPIDGIETTERIPAELMVPVVYLTAYSDEETLARARETRPYGYLLKPFTPRELHATIQMVLERRRADVASRDSEARLEQLVEVRTAELVLANRELREQTAARIKAEQNLRQVQKMEAVGQLTGGLAHELNNLLTVVMGNLDFIRSEPKDEVRVISRADSARTAVERAARLIKQLLMFARRQIMRPVTVDLNRLIDEFDKLFVHGPNKEIELVTRLDPDLSPSHLDPAQFESAILNLVMNARDAISDVGRIVIETQNVELGPDFAAENPDMAPGGYVMVTVSDTGAGISDDIISRVFDPFFTTKGVGEGAGLGLSQVYGFAKESGGHVRIDSTVGVGTTVRLYLPRSDDVPVDAQPGSNRALARMTSSAVTVLVVEDDEMVLTLAGDILREFGYRLLTAGDAAAALVILNGDEPIDILFSDVSMPGGMNGVQLAVEARRLRPGIKVLLTSGYPATLLASQHGLESNMPLLGKPYRPQQLADTFRIILDEV